MTGADLWAESSTALASVSPAQDRHLLALGVPAPQLQICGAVRATVDGSTYQPDPDGAPLVVVPARMQDEVIDLIAFHTIAPERWWRRSGLADYLGGDALDAVWHDELIDVFRTPLSWLRQGAPADGVVILNPVVARLDIAFAEIVDSVRLGGLVAGDGFQQGFQVALAQIGQHLVAPAG